LPIGQTSREEVDSFLLAKIKSAEAIRDGMFMGPQRKEQWSEGWEDLA
jgi:hypothetical protein